MKTRIITRSIIVAVMVAMTAVSGYAQDSYREAVKEYMTANGASQMMKSMLLNMNQALFNQTDNVNIDELTERYFKERFEDEFVKMMEPSMKACELTEGDLKEVTRLLSTPEGKQYATHAIAWTQKMPGAFISSMLNNLSHDTDIDKWADIIIDIDPDVNADFAAKFHQMWDKLIPDDKWQEILKEGMKEDTTQRNAAMVKWLSNNLETILLNSAHKYLTMEDLDYNNWLSTHESFLKTKGINYNRPSSSEEFKSLLDGYSEWMEANGAQPNDDDDEIAMGMIETMSDFWGFELPKFGHGDYDKESDCLGLDEFEGYFDGEITERDQLTSTIVIHSSQDLLDMYDIEITYKGEDGINVTETITTPRWVKTVVNKNFPTQIGIEGCRLFLKPGVKADKETYDLVCDFTMAAQQFGYNFKIVEERNVPADKVLSIFDDYDFRSYQEEMIKSWGADDISYRGTFTVEKENDPDYPFHFIHD